ncbi:MAG: hypothetical protein RL346_309 [Verrucomicrobiota bacterium]|jgi:tetratricopeptide (TPR) repeat protein
MAFVSALLWITGFALSAILGPTLKIWTWGPTMLCFAAAAAIALPDILRDGLGRLNLYVLLSGIASASWFAGRAWFSPAHELALTDLALVTMSVSTFLIVQHTFRSRAAQAAMVIGIALLLCANLAVMIRQMGNIEYHVLISHTNRIWPAGFFRHYSHCATFLIGSSLLLAGFALKSTWPPFSRALLLMIAIAGLAAVYITKSRSGMLGAGIGVTALIFYWAMSAKRDEKPWSGLLLLIAPLMLFGVIVTAFSLLEQVQQVRNEGSDLIDMLDNDLRLHLYGIAVACIQLHPLIGGGSRSFSWESYAFWNTNEMGLFSADPEHVHNESIQVLTDYGIIGGVLLLSFVIGLLILCTFRTASKGIWSKQDLADAWRIGGAAAFLGIFAQSNFEGTLRIAPGAILLGMCLAAIGHGFHSGHHPFRMRNGLLAACCLAGVVINSFYGWKGSSVLGDYGWEHYSKIKESPHERIASLSRGLKTWPLESIYAERGMFRTHLAESIGDQTSSMRLLEDAVEDFKAAGRLHPHAPLYARNTAVALSRFKNDAAAHPYFERAIRLQGGMEAVYKTHFYYASHLFRYANSLHARELHDKSAELYRQSIAHLEMTPGYIHGAEFYELQLHAHLNLAIALRHMKDYASALQSFDTASQLRGGNHAYHLAAAMLAKRGVDLLSKKRPAEALRLFIEAQQRANRCQSTPPDLQEKDRLFLKNYLKTRIRILHEAGHKPSETLVFE